MDSPNLQLDLPDPRINPAVYFFLPPEQAQYQLDHIDESKASQIIISHFICLGIACVATTLRFISRGLCKARYQANDFLILISFVFFVVYVSMVLLVVFRYGGGQHAILLKDPIKFAKVSFRIGGLARKIPLTFTDCHGRRDPLRTSHWIHQTQYNCPLQPLVQLPWRPLPSLGHCSGGDGCLYCQCFLDHIPMSSD